MSTLTRRSNGNRVPDYKDYMSFVSAYRNGKKEVDSNEDNTFILPENNSTKMVPEVSGFSGKVCDSYSSFLEKTKNKKFSSVKPPSGVVQSIKEPQRMKVKTEIFLEINDETKSTPKRLELSTTDNKGEDEETIAAGQVEARKKMFEGRTQSENKLTNGHHQKMKTITLKQKFETNHNQTEENSVTIPPKQIIQRMNSFNNIKTETAVPEIKIQVSELKSNNCDKSDGTDEPTQIPKTVETENLLNFHLIEKKNNEMQADVTNRQKFIGQLNETLKFKTSVTMEPEVTKIEDVAENICSVSIPKENSANVTIPPPPPPPMPNGLKQIPTMNKFHKKPSEDNRERENKTPPLISHIYSMNETDSSQKSGLKNQKSSTLERTNPLVRKLAYGAMLDMYGAYHDKANSYVSTLPRQHVKKDNGLQKIIDSIAAQGGLDKLSGRSNPKAENE